MHSTDRLTLIRQLLPELEQAATILANAGHVPLAVDEAIGLLRDIQSEITREGTTASPAAVHGQTCTKRKHRNSGYLHSPSDDGPFTDDGVVYCGRCHVALPNGYFVSPVNYPRGRAMTAERLAEIRELVAVPYMAATLYGMHKLAAAIQDLLPLVDAAQERRRFALLQAAAQVWAIHGDVAGSVGIAEMLLAEIERREKP